YAVSKNVALSPTAATGVLANDTDPNGDPLTAVLVSNVTHGSLTLNGNGSFTYTPATGFTGTDSFTYQARDNSLALSNTATVTLTVNNQAPTAVNDDYSLNKNS